MKSIQSNLKILRRLEQEWLPVELIAESLKWALANEAVEEVRERMEAHHWDVMGVRDNEASPIRRYVRRESLTGTSCGETADEFRIDELVSVHAPIRECLPRLCDGQHLFVLGRNGVEGIVTLADLQKQPVRLLLFAAVSLLEMAMLAKIRNACAEEEWIGTLTADRIEKARYLQEERRKKNQDLDLVDCLQLCDKTTILIENDALRAECGFLSMKKPQKFFKSAQSLRDNLAHGQDPTDGSNWANVCELLTGIDTITHQIAGKDDSPTLCETGDEQ